MNGLAGPSSWRQGVDRSPQDYPKEGVRLRSGFRSGAGQGVGGEVQDSGIGRFEASTSFTTPATTISTRSDPVLPEAGRMHYQMGLNMRVPVPGRGQE